MVKDGIWYGLGLVAVAAVVGFAMQDWILSIPPLLLAAFFLWFFRDPTRTIPAAPGSIVSPADGVVTEAEWVETTQGSRLRVSIFLNVFDVHVNRSPIAGTVKLVEHREGGFMNAMTPESSLTNEQTLIQIEGEGCEVSLKQIAGLLARRIVCNLVEGQKVVRGERIGMIKFGSRCDVLMPAEATLKVKTGVRVKGGSSILAQMPVPGGSCAGNGMNDAADVA
jgi:phosphatidylserine decarboxylase